MDDLTSELKEANVAAKQLVSHFERLIVASNKIDELLVDCELELRRKAYLQRIRSDIARIVGTYDLTITVLTETVAYISERNMPEWARSNDQSKN